MPSGAARRWRWSSTACRREAIEEVRGRPGPDAAAHGLGNAPLFVIPEVPLVDDLLPDEVIDRLRSWLTALARDAKAPVDGRPADPDRHAAGRWTPASATLVTPPRRSATPCRTCAATSPRRTTPRTQPSSRASPTARCCGARSSPAGRSSSAPESCCATSSPSVGRMRDRFMSAVRGRPAPSEELGEALQTGVAALVTCPGARGRRRRRPQVAGQPGRGGPAGRPPGARPARRRPLRSGRPDGPRLAGASRCSWSATRVAGGARPPGCCPTASTASASS